MKTKEATEKAGSAKALAAILKVTPSAISQWGDDLPMARQWQLKLLKPSWFRVKAAA